MFFLFFIFWDNQNPISIQRVPMYFDAPFETVKKWTNSFFFSYRNTYKIRHYKKDNGNLTLNYFIYEFHSNRNTYPTETNL